MTKLEDLEKDLYTEDGGKLESRLRRPIILDGKYGNLPTSWIGRDKKKKLGLVISNSSMYIKILVGFFAVALIIGVSAFVFLYLGTRGGEVEISVGGNERIEAGGVFTLPVIFKNVSKETLREAELTIVTPEGSLVREGGLDKPLPSRLIEKLDDLDPGETRTKEITVRIFGKEGEKKNVEAVILYRPESLRARFSSRTVKSLTINRVPLAVFMEAPETVSYGQEMELKVKYISTSRDDFQNISLRLDYPPGFVFKSSDPAPSVDNFIWEIGNLAAGEEGSVVVRGNISGEEGEIKSFSGEVGIYNKLTRVWGTYIGSSREARLAVTPFSVKTFLTEKREGFVTPGERLEFKIRYKNNTDFLLRSASLRVFLEGDILDKKSLIIDNGGVFDVTADAIVWGPGGTRELSNIEPGSSGEFGFRLTIKTQPVVRGAGDKNLTVKVRSTGEVADLPRELEGTDLNTEDRAEFKVKSIVTLAGRTVHRASPIINTGSLPPTVGKETTYTVIWEIRNFTNDLRNAEIRATIPPNIKWKNVFLPSDARIGFDESLGEVRWFIGEVKSATGVLTPALSASFQLALTPAESDVGTSPVLINESRLTAIDTFTGEKVEVKFPLATTEIRDDPGTTLKEWKVVK